MALFPEWSVSRFNDETGRYETLARKLWAEWDCAAFAEGYLHHFPNAKLLYVHNPV